MPVYACSVCAVPVSASLFFFVPVRFFLRSYTVNQCQLAQLTTLLYCPVIEACNSCDILNCSLLGNCWLYCDLQP
uniref:Uncharacterized protein n=1 Tax=Rhipicephalus pulchellus TaxID=72859 RepID=L7LUW9_RHIPC